MDKLGDSLIEMRRNNTGIFLACKQCNCMDYSCTLLKYGVLNVSTYSRNRENRKIFGSKFHSGSKLHGSLKLIKAG